MTGPSRHVLELFGLSEPAFLLPGGQGETWRSGSVVLKRAGSESVWRAEVLASLAESEEFRVARPVRTVEGEWIGLGWEGSELLAGETDVSRQDEGITAGIAFHEAIGGLPPPDFLDARDAPWSVGDRVAWEERSIDGSTASLEVVASLL